MDNLLNVYPASPASSFEESLFDPDDKAGSKFSPSWNSQSGALDSM